MGKTKSRVGRNPFEAGRTSNQAKLAKDKAADKSSKKSTAAKRKDLKRKIASTQIPLTEHRVGDLGICARLAEGRRQLREQVYAQMDEYFGKNWRQKLQSELHKDWKSRLVELTSRINRTYRTVRT